MDAPSGYLLDERAARRTVLVFSAAVVSAFLVHRFSPAGADPVRAFSAPDWLPLAAALAAAMAAIPANGRSAAPPLVPAARWVALLLMLWMASGLPFDLLTMAGLVGHRTASGTIVMSTVDWPLMATRAFALCVVVILGRLVLSVRGRPPRARQARWYGLAAFAFALPYPLLRIHWALGGTLGLDAPGAAGEGWEPVLIAIPWVLAAVLSLMLVAPPRWVPRRLLVGTGWTATAIVAMIGPAAIWSFASSLVSGADTATGGIAVWVFGLFYGSWALWAVAGAAATRAYQLRTASPESPPAG